MRSSLKKIFQKLKLEIYLRRKDNETIRLIAKKTGIAKSTLHYKLSSIEQRVEERKKRFMVSSKSTVRQGFKLCNGLKNICQNICSKLLKDVDGLSICSTMIGTILTLCADIANNLTTMVDL